jgi:hypothetical protein
MLYYSLCHIALRVLHSSSFAYLLFMLIIMCVFFFQPPIANTRGSITTIPSAATNGTTASATASTGRRVTRQFRLPDFANRARILSSLSPEVAAAALGSAPVAIAHSSLMSSIKKSDTVSASKSPSAASSSKSPSSSSFASRDPRTNVLAAIRQDGGAAVRQQLEPVTSNARVPPVSNEQRVATMMASLQFNARQRRASLVAREANARNEAEKEKENEREADTHSQNDSFKPPRRAVSFSPAPIISVSAADAAIAPSLSSSLMSPVAAALPATPYASSKSESSAFEFGADSFESSSASVVTFAATGTSAAGTAANGTSSTGASATGKTSTGKAPLNTYASPVPFAHRQRVAATARSPAYHSSSASSSTSSSSSAPSASGALAALASHSPSARGFAKVAAKLLAAKSSASTTSTGHTSGSVSVNANASAKSGPSVQSPTAATARVQSIASIVAPAIDWSKAGFTTAEPKWRRGASASAK